MNILEFVTRLSFAIFIGFFIGLERQFTGHQAGIRTNILICFSSCLFLQFPMIMELNEDIGRIASYIISGVGFLCSGVIFKEGGNVKGLNTAATLWSTAAVGVITSSGNFIFASIAGGILILANLIFRPIANKIYPITTFHENECRYIVSVICFEALEIPLRSILIKFTKGKKIYLSNLESGDLIGDKVEIKAEYICYTKEAINIMEILVISCLNHNGVISSGWEQIH